MKNILVLLVWLSIGYLNTAAAQNYDHTALWTRLQLNKMITGRTELMVGAHWRRQNNYQISNINPLSNPLMYGGQMQLSRWNTKKSFVFHVAQITCFWSNQLLGKEADFKVPLNREWRYAFGPEWVQRPTKKWTLRERFLQEFRFFRSNNDQVIGRIRGRIQAIGEINSKLNFISVAEVVLHDPPQLTGFKDFRYHQTWLSAGFVWKFNKHVNLETSYTFINGRRNSVVEFDNQNVLNVLLFLRM